jgi:hypothetical protein
MGGGVFRGMPTPYPALDFSFGIKAYLISLISGASHTWDNGVADMVCKIIRNAKAVNSRKLVPNSFHSFPKELIFY